MSSQLSDTEKKVLDVIRYAEQLGLKVEQICWDQDNPEYGESSISELLDNNIWNGACVGVQLGLQFKPIVYAVNDLRNELEPLIHTFDSKDDAEEFSCEVVEAEAAKGGG